jgi:hypothetical protein
VELDLPDAGGQVRQAGDHEAKAACKAPRTPFELPDRARSGLPFTGGAVRFFTYDFTHQFEVPRRAVVDIDIPEAISYL